MVLEYAAVPYERGTPVGYLGSKGTSGDRFSESNEDRTLRVARGSAPFRLSDGYAWCGDASSGNEEC